MKKWILCTITLLFSFFSGNIAIAKFTGTSFPAGKIGADYNPDHYSSTNAFNNHDVFYVGNNNSGAPISNVYSELSQLYDAGFYLIRSYATTVYSWVEIINAANTLNNQPLSPTIQIIFEANVGNGSNTDSARTLMHNVINTVGETVFKNTVALVLIGHENYNGSNASQLSTAEIAFRKDLRGYGIPVADAFTSPDVVSPPNADIGSIIANSSLPTSQSTNEQIAPVAFDPYPFQWGVPVANAVTNGSVSQSIQSDLNQVVANKFTTNYPSNTNRTMLLAETGWASAGTTSPGYACSQGTPYLPCEPSEANEATYLSALYPFVLNTANNVSALVFYAYDEPAKAASSSMEDYYGVFNDACSLKSSDTALLPPGNHFNLSTDVGCQGYSQGGYVVVQGGYGSNDTNMTVTITQTNPSTTHSQNMTIPSVSAHSATNGWDGNTWPYFLAYTGATFSIAGNNGAIACTGTITAISNQQVTGVSWTAKNNCNFGDNTIYV